jgi:hypothetical protein
MSAQLIVDCSGRAISALLVTMAGELVPCSQEIRHVATRHASADILFDGRVAEDPDFSWEESLAAIAGAGAVGFFQRARRLGIRRPWDDQASAEALQLASPLAVLSSPTALADRAAGGIVPAVGFVLLNALLEPTFAFLIDRGLAFGDIDPIVIVPAETGRAARLVLYKLFRRRGFPRPTFVRRELAAAMALIEEAPCELVVLDAAGDDLHLHRVALEEEGGARSVRTLVSTTVRDFGWTHWTGRIAAALNTPASSKFRRALIALLIGSPDSLEPRLTHGELQAALDGGWVDAERPSVANRLREALERIDAEHLPRVVIGEVFAAQAMVQLFGGAPGIRIPILEHSLRSVALAWRWLASDTSRRLLLAANGSLRLDTLHGGAVELVPAATIPPPGQACFVETHVRLAGEPVADKAFLVHLLWGSDPSPSGNATLCAVPLRLPRDHSSELRLTTHLRRSRSGCRVSGTVHARVTGATTSVATRMRFTEELEVKR